MRSELIFGALTHISNRYQLCQLASKATRKLHKPNTRLQDTMNDVLVRFRENSPAAAVPLSRHEPLSIPQHPQRRAA
ncbi:MAG: DNA-directed RNA polymerase subunit omega [Acidobacteriaceae bacterium]